MLSFARLSNQVPVDRVHVAERRVLLETNGASHDGGEAVQSDFLEIHHLERDQSVVDEQRVASNHGQVRKETADAP